MWTFAPITRERKNQLNVKKENYEDLERISDYTIRMYYRQSRYHIRGIHVRIVSMSVQAIRGDHTLFFGEVGKRAIISQESRVVTILNASIIIIILKWKKCKAYTRR